MEARWHVGGSFGNKDERGILKSLFSIILVGGFCAIDDLGTIDRSIDRSLATTHQCFTVVTTESGFELSRGALE